MPLAQHSFGSASPRRVLDTMRLHRHQYAGLSVLCVHARLSQDGHAWRADLLCHGGQPHLSKMKAQRLCCLCHTAHQTCGYSRKYASCSWRSASLHEIIRGPSSRSVHTSTTTRPSSQPRLTSRCSPYSSRASSRVSIGRSKTDSHLAKSISCLRWFRFRSAGSYAMTFIVYAFIAVNKPLGCGSWPNKDVQRTGQVPPASELLR